MEKRSAPENIKKILILQERDRGIARCVNELAEIAPQKQASEATINQYRESAETTKETLKTIQASIHKLEVENETCRQQIAKLREQQFQIKSNNEYKALDHEIANIQETIKGLEDREIELLEEVDQAQADLKRGTSELEQKETKIKLELEQFEKQRKNLESEIDQIRNDRERLTSGIDEDWLNRYNRIMENKKDIALVTLENGACGGCHMKLPAYIRQDVRKADSIVSCSFCGRMLYFMP